MARRIRTKPIEINIAFITFWYTLTCCAVILFLYGFFPIKSSSTNSVIDPPSFIKGIKLNAIDLYEAKIDRIALIVIDALRMDFINEKSMPFLGAAVHGEDGCILATKAESPTVTMPRIKALTTGSVPQFIDIVFNLASSEIKEDSFLQRARDLGKNSAFYGDETWLKLFPRMFFRSDGTTSFYVTDYTEVDDNVTRHLNSELQKEDWSLLILHYLGLDHIGHVSGPTSPLIQTKLLEMDNIIQRIYEAIDNTSPLRTAVLVCADHGMRDSGGHGGSSYAEVTVPFAVLGVGECGHSFVGSQAAQTDLAPTISVLLGLPIPADSIGRVLPQLLDTHSLASQLYIYYYNALVLIKKAAYMYGKEFQECFQLHEEFLMNLGDGLDALKLYQEKLLKVSEKLIKTSSTQTVSYLYISLNYLICGLMSLAFPSTSRLNFQVVCAITIFFIIESFVYETIMVTHWLSIISSVFVLYMVLPVIYSSQYPNQSSSIEKFLLWGSVGSTVCLTATSFIEEEHQTWYFLWGSLILLTIYQQLGASRMLVATWTCMFFGFRILRTFNQASPVDEMNFSDWLRLPENFFWLNFVFICGLAGVWVCCLSHIPDNNTSVSYLTLATLVSMLLFRTAQLSKSAIYEARACQILAALTIAVHSRTNAWGAHTLTLAWTLWSSLLLRPYNVILVPACCFASRCLLVKKASVHVKIYSHLWLSALLFFCQGNSNSLASIDISPGYIGLREYSPFITTFQVLSHTYIFPVLCQLLLFSSLDTKHRIEMLRCLTAFRVLNITYFCIITLIHRNHLFVWSVFSPKLLIESCHTFVTLIFILLYSIINHIYI